MDDQSIYRIYRRMKAEMKKSKKKEKEKKNGTEI
jgi:hypothetical protein